MIELKQLGIMNDKKSFECTNRVYDDSGLCPTITGKGGGQSA